MTAWAPSDDAENTVYRRTLEVVRSGETFDLLVTVRCGRGGGRCRREVAWVGETPEGALYQSTWRRSATNSRAAHERRAYEKELRAEKGRGPISDQSDAMFVLLEYLGPNGESWSPILWAGCPKHRGRLEVPRDDLMAQIRTAREHRKSGVLSLSDTQC